MDVTETETGEIRVAPTAPAERETTSSCSQKVFSCKPTPAEKGLFILFLAISLFVKGTSLFNIGYALDDYPAQLQTDTSPPTSNIILSSGRFVGYLLLKYSNKLNISSVHAPGFYGGLALVGLVAAALVICRLWSVSNNVLCSAVVVGLILFHPYQAELLTWKLAFVSFVPALLTGFGAIYICSRRIVPFIGAVILMVVSLGAYQIVFQYIVEALLIGLVVRWFIRAASNDPTPWKKAFVEDDYLFKLLLIPVGFAVYWVTNLIILSASKLQMTERGQILPFSEWPARYKATKQLLYSIAVKGEPIAPLFLKYVLLFVLVFAAVALLWQIWIRKSLRAAGDVVIAVVLVLLSALAVIGLMLFTSSWWPVPRVLSGLGIFWAGIFCIACLGFCRWVRPIPVAAGVLAVFISAAFMNRIAIDQVRINLRDRALAERIVDRLENYPDFGKIKRLTVIGGFYNYPLRIPTSVGGLNISAFGAPWSKVPLLSEVSGRDFGKVTAAELEMAKQRARATPKWPAAESIYITNDLAIVYLTDGATQ